MKSPVHVGALASLILLLFGGACSSDLPVSGPAAPETGSVSSSPTRGIRPTFRRESARTIRECGVRRKFDVNGIANPCEQAGHLEGIFKRNEAWKRQHGFSIQVGSIGKCGIRLTVDGNVAAARKVFDDDPLVARVTSIAQGFPTDC